MQKKLKKKINVAHVVEEDGESPGGSHPPPPRSPLPAGEGAAAHTLAVGATTKKRWSLAAAQLLPRQSPPLAGAARLSPSAG
jgi:hypothetical protein